ncbi:MAG: SpoIID/LytB domain-containing protein [Spirochaetaceae bacterium]|nr:MAG: SpoIID/LytB domain-containing protein [Spirochaetaceae bacterium]
MRGNPIILALIAIVLTGCSPAGAQDIPVDRTEAELPPYLADPTPGEAARAWYEGDPGKAAAIYGALLESGDVGEESGEESGETPGEDDLRLSLLLLLREAGEVDRAAEVAAELRDHMPAEFVMTRLLAGKAVPPEDEGDAGTRELFWRGAAEMLHGSTRRADRMLREVVGRENHFPYAHLFRGLLARDRGDWDGAIDHLTRTLRQDSNITLAFLPLAEAKFARGEAREAWDLISRAALALPWDEDVRSLRAAWEADRPDLVAARAAEVARRRVVAEPPVVAVTPRDREAIPRVRVGLAENLSSVYLKTGGPFRIVTVPDDLAYYNAEDRLGILRDALEQEPLVRGERGTVLHVQFDRQSGELVMRDATATSDAPVQAEAAPDGAVLVRHDRPLRLVYDDPSDTTIVFDLAYGQGQFSAGREDRSYRGDMEFVAGLAPGPVERFTLVNDVNVEEYLYSVVPSEMPASWPEAALEAQAVAARSYTLHRRTRFHARGFDLQSSVVSAYYRGVTGEHPRTTRAVEATRGRVLSEGRGTLDAVYSANAAGYTEASESVWGFATSLVSVSDPQLPPLGEGRSPAEVYRWILDRPDSFSGHPDFASASAYRWSLLVAREDIERRLASAGTAVGDVVRIVPGPRGITGRVESVRVIGTEGETVVNRDAIRSRLGGLRSNLFVLAPRYAQEDGAPPARLPLHFYFEGAGWGHGVGMCQTGAAGMAAEGHSSAEILAHYYPRNEQVDWY